MILFGGSGVDYQPNDNFVGDDTFTYTVIDETGKTSTATVTVTVEVPPNEPPLAFNDDLMVAKDGGAQSLDVLANDTALPDVGETLTITSIVTVPTNGTATDFRRRHYHPLYARSGLHRRGHAELSH